MIDDLMVSDEQLQKFEAAMARARKNPKRRMTVAGFDMTCADLLVFDRTKALWLNDLCVDAALDCVVNEQAKLRESRPSLPRCIAQTVHFMPKLLEGQRRAQSWNAACCVGDDPASIVLAPFNVKGNHWVLAVLDTRRNLAAYFDSNPGDDTQEAGKVALGALADWYNTVAPARAWQMVVNPAGATPVQSDSSSCGLYVLNTASCIAGDVPLCSCGPVQIDRHSRPLYALKLIERSELSQP